MAWQNVLDKTNATLHNQGRSPIRRFHAAELNGGKGEFKGWTQEERVELAKNLIRVIRYHQSTHMALTMELSDLLAEWPENNDDVMSFGYNLLLKLFMIKLGEVFEQENLCDRVEFVVERGPGLEAMQDAFTQMMEDENFRYKRFFVSIREGNWESDLLLQVADLFAYEAYRDALRREKQKEPRPSMEALLELDSMGISTQRLPREAIAELRKQHNEHSALDSHSQIDGESK